MGRTTNRRAANGVRLFLLYRLGRAVSAAGRGMMRLGGWVSGLGAGLVYRSEGVILPPAADKAEKKPCPVAAARQAGL